MPELPQERWRALGSCLPEVREAWWLHPVNPSALARIQTGSPGSHSASSSQLPAYHEAVTGLFPGGGKSPEPRGPLSQDTVKSWLSLCVPMCAPLCKHLARSFRLSCGRCSLLMTYGRR